MLEAIFQFDSDDAGFVRDIVSGLSGVRVTMSGDGPYLLDTIVWPPFDEGRFDNILNIIAGLATNVTRLPVEQ